MSEIQLPIQPVADPILCSPYEEPDRHWLYNTRTGIPSKVQARREASYWYKSERTGSAQMSLLAEEERDDLPLVNALRDDVRRWRNSGWQNASETTKKRIVGFEGELSASNDRKMCRTHGRSGYQRQLRLAT